MKKFNLEITLEDEDSCHGCPRLQMGDRFGTWVCTALEKPAATSWPRPKWCPLKEVEEA
jgi:hypothetical protein